MQLNMHAQFCICGDAAQASEISPAHAQTRHTCCGAPDCASPRTHDRAKVVDEPRKNIRCSFGHGRAPGRLVIIVLYAGKSHCFLCFVARLLTVRLLARATVGTILSQIMHHLAAPGTCDVEAKYIIVTAWAACRSTIPAHAYMWCGRASARMVNAYVCSIEISAFCRACTGQL